MVCFNQDQLASNQAQPCHFKLINISAIAPAPMAVCLMGNVSWMAKVIGIGLIMMLLDETKFKP